MSLTAGRRGSGNQYMMWVVGWEAEPAGGCSRASGKVVFESQYKGNIHSHFPPRSRKEYSSPRGMGVPTPMHTLQCPGSQSDLASPSPVMLWLVLLSPIASHMNI